MNTILGKEVIQFHDPKLKLYVSNVSINYIM